MPRIKELDSPYPVVRAAQRFGELVNIARRARGWTQADLAAMSGISVSTLYAAEKGDARIALHAWLKLLWATGQLDRISEVLDPMKDESLRGDWLASLPRRVKQRTC